MRKPNKIKRSLKFSFFDGIFAAGMLGMTTDYITPYALALKATVSQIGLLSAIPNFVASLAQLFSADITDRLKSRRKAINTFVFLHALMGIPIILIPYLFTSSPVLFLIIFVTLFTGFNAVAMPAWLSLMSDYVPPRMRGRYFGWRNKILATVAVTTAFTAGLILHIFKNNVLRGFLIVFSCAFIFRFVSWCFLIRMYEKPFRVNSQAYFSFFDFIRRARESNFARFVIFAAALTFCVNLAAPFFSVFMLRDLKFSYLTYALIVTTVTIVNILVFDRWGKVADRVGNIKVIKATALIIISLPLLWIVNHSPLYLIFVQILAGFSWAGFNLCAANFIYDAVTPQKRVRCFAYFNALNGLAVCLGALSGGYLVNVLPKLLGYNILTLFLISGFLRFIVVFLFFNKIKEVRISEKMSNKDLFFTVAGLKPIK